MKNKIRPTIVIIVILIIPFFYVLFFLKAFWDPYANMENVPVAIVNLDKGKIGKDIVDKLKESKIMKVELLSDDNKALQGVENNKYYSSITIPSNFTENIYNLKENKIIFRSNKKFNFIASQIYERASIEIQSTIKNQISNEIAIKLYNSVNSSLDKTKQLNEGLLKLSQGSEKLNKGLDTLSDKYTEFNGGINTLNKGIDTLNQGLNKYIDGVNQSTYALDQISKGVLTLGDKVGILQWNSNFRQLYDGAKEVQNIQVKHKLDDAGIQLKAGIDKIVNGINKVAIASEKVKTAINSIDDGSLKINKGLEFANSKISSSVKINSEKLKSLDNLPHYLANSINLEIQNINDVENYGTVFSAYFISIALWVGALVIMVVLYYDAKLRFGIFDRSYKNKYKQYAMYLGLIFIQAPILTFLINSSFKFLLINVWYLWLSILVIDLTFFSMIYFFIILFDDIGKFISIMLLIVQISASAGTFPIETTPKIFIKMFPFIPMKYSINILKDSIAGFNKSTYLNNISVLLVILIIFIILTLITIYIQMINKKNKFFRKKIKKLKKYIDNKK